ncbi:hypothetical protein ABVN23_29315 [Pseudomonas fluorescens]|uniref:hypothetical protein n=1 Tax=Pseudomonas fluorescens TaxID=294 RepID=UPI003F9AC2FB
MSEINHASVYYHRLFPNWGGCHGTLNRSIATSDEQNQQGRDYHDALSVEAGRG